MNNMYKIFSFLLGIAVLNSAFAAEILDLPLTHAPIIKPTSEQEQQIKLGIKREAEERARWEEEYRKRREEQNTQLASKFGTTVETIKKAESELATIGDNLDRTIPHDRRNDFNRAFNIVTGYPSNFIADPRVMAVDFAEWKKSLVTVANFFNDNKAILSSTLVSILNSPTLQRIAHDVMRKYGIDEQQINFTIMAAATIPSQLPGIIEKFKTFVDYVNLNIKHA